MQSLTPSCQAKSMGSEGLTTTFRIAKSLPRFSTRISATSIGSLTTSSDSLFHIWSFSSPKGLQLSVPAKECIPWCILIHNPTHLRPDRHQFMGHCSHQLKWSFQTLVSCHFRHQTGQWFHNYLLPLHYIRSSRFYLFHQATFYDHAKNTWKCFRIWEGPKYF